MVPKAAEQAALAEQVEQVCLEPLVEWLIDLSISLTSILRVHD
jgi:hypothetical protein